LAGTCDALLQRIAERPAEGGDDELGRLGARLRTSGTGEDGQRGHRKNAGKPA